MICPCCAVGEMSKELDTCDLCGYSTKANVATDEEPTGKSGVGAEPSKTKIKVPKKGRSGLGIAVTVEIRDAGGKPVKRGGDTVVVAVTGVNRARPKVTDVGNGTYTATYTPTKAGEDRISVTVNGVPVAGSPFLTQVGSGKADPSQTTTTVPAGCAGVATTFTVTTRDASGNNLTSGGDVVTVSIAGPNQHETVDVTDNGDSTYLASYVPNAAGTDEIIVSVNGLEIGGSPFSTDVKPGASSAAHCTATLRSAGTPGYGSAITVRACDAYGNRVRRGGARVVVAVDGANKARPTVTDVGNGSYTATYTPTAVGTDTIVITFDGTPIAASPVESVIVVGDADASQTVASIPNGRAGEASVITVRARDPHGNDLTAGGDHVDVHVSGANVDSAVVDDAGSGTYTARYMPMQAGSDEISISINGVEIAGSPFTSVVDPSSPAAIETRATIPRNARAGEATTLLFEMRDAYGNEVLHGGDVIVVAVGGENVDANVNVTDNENGTYSATYVPTKVGVDTVDVRLNGSRISAKPFKTRVVAGRVAPGRGSVRIGPGHVGAPVHLTMVSRDSHNNPLTSGGLDVSVLVAGANDEVKVAVTDEGNGTYIGTYTPRFSGTDYLTVVISGTPIEDSPVACDIGAGAIAAMKCDANLPSVSRAGTRTSIIVTTRDSFGNRLTVGGGKLHTEVSGSNASLNVEVADNGDGTYVATYVPTRSGIDEFSITINGDPIAGHPYSHLVEAGSPDPNQTTAEAPKHGRVSQPFAINVFTRDKFGNELTVGGAKVELSITGANDQAKGKVLDRNDGTYEVSYVPQHPGTDRVTVKLNGEPVGSGPIRPTIAVGAASGAKSSATVPDGRAGKQTQLTIKARDGSGNDLATGGDQVTVAVSVSNTADAAVVDNGDGTYSAAYTPMATGTDYVTITMNGSAVAGSPFVSRVVAGATDPEKTEIMVPPVALAGAPTTVFVRARDAFGNAIKHGGQMLQVVVAGANDGSSLRITDNRDGTYAATYTPTKAGEDQVSLRMGGEAIGNAAYKSLVQPGLPSAVQSTAVIPDGEAGGLTRADIVVRDAYRNQVATGGHPVKFALIGANAKANLQVTDNRDGTYTVTYTPTIAGTDSLRVAIDGLDLRDSPFHSQVAPGVAVSEQTRADVPAGRAGEQTAILVNVRDAFGNRLTRGGHALAAGITGANEGVPIDIVDGHDGSYEVLYTPTRAGVDAVTISMDGKTIGQGTASSDVRAGLADAARCTAVVPIGLAGTQTAIKIAARDSLGNQIEHGGDEVAVNIAGGNLGSPVAIGDNGDGTYRATYTPAIAGNDSITIFVNGSPINGSPFSSQVGAGNVAPQKCTATIPSGRVEHSTTISIVVRDGFGNQLARGGEAVEVAVNGANAGTPAYVTDLGNGTYTATYTPKATGVDELEILVNGAHIGGGPFASVVTNAPVETARHSGAQQTKRLTPPVPTKRVSGIGLAIPMSCPRCAVAQISDENGQCELCGYTPPARVPHTPTSRPSVSALHANVQREVGTQLKIQTAFKQGERVVSFLAHDVDRDEPVVLKVIPFSAPADIAVLERFKQEAHWLATFKQAQIMPVLRFGATPDFVWFTTPHIEGRTLTEVLASADHLSLTETRRIVGHLTSAVDYMHRLGRVHGNVKPECILIFGKEVVVTDAGISLAYVTSEYSAPELERGTGDRRADQYAVGTIAYESLLGTHPIDDIVVDNAEADDDEDGDDEDAVVRYRLLEERDDLPKSVVAALKRAMERDPAKRFPSMIDFMKQFGATPPAYVPQAPRLSSASEASMGSPRVLFPEGHRRSTRVRNVIVIATIIVLAIILWVVFKPAGPAAPRALDQEQNGLELRSPPSWLSSAAEYDISLL